MNFVIRDPEKDALDLSRMAKNAGMKVCPCGRAFTPYRSYQNYCCDAHRVKYRGGLPSAYKKKPETGKICRNPECGKGFKSNDNKRLYCSHECYLKVREDRKVEPTERVCPECGEVFQSSHWSKTRCGKKECAAKARGRRR